MHATVTFIICEFHILWAKGLEALLFKILFQQKLTLREAQFPVEIAIHVDVPDACLSWVFRTHRPTFNFSDYKYWYLLVFIELFTLGKDFMYVILTASEDNPASSSVSKKPHDLCKEAKNQGYRSALSDPKAKSLTPPPLEKNMILFCLVS